MQSQKNVQPEVKPKQTLSQAVDAYNKAEKENLLQEEKKASDSTVQNMNDAESEEDKLDKLRTAFKID